MYRIGANANISDKKSPFEILESNLNQQKPAIYEENIRNSSDSNRLRSNLKNSSDTNRVKNLENNNKSEKKDMQKSSRSNQNPTSHERSIVERMPSPHIRIANDQNEKIPDFYNKSNNYLDAIRNIKMKNNEMANQKYDNRSNLNNPSSKKILMVDLRKEQSKFLRYPKGDKKLTSNRGNQPEYVIDNIGNERYQRLMEENDDRNNKLYKDRNPLANNNYMYEKSEKSKTGQKRKVQVEIDRLIQDQMSRI